MRALSLTQPYAQLVAIGAKRWETRSWSTGYRGPLAIHAAKTFPLWARELTRTSPFAELLGSRSLPLGVFVAVAYLENCQLCWPSTAEEVGYPEREFGDFAAGRYRMRLGEVKPLAKYIPWRGALSLWSVPPEIAIRLHALGAPAKS